MELWIPVTLAAASFQTLRFMLQKSLSSVALSAGGATFARFFYSAPVVLIVLAAYLGASGRELPPLPAPFWIFAATGGLINGLITDEATAVRLLG